MIVVFDTNIWIKELALTSKTGSAVRFFLRERNARIVLPEVVKLETESNLRTTITKHINEIQNSHRQLLSMFGRLKEVVLPTSEDVEKLVSQVFTNLKVPIEEVPFSLESARASLMRVIAHLPPNGPNNQQFKDGVLWEDCLTMLNKAPVFLVTGDTDFYKNLDYKLGLADELKRDVGRFPNELKIYSKLSDLLSEIKTNVQINPDTLINAFMEKRGESIQGMIAAQSFLLSGPPVAEYELFVTENPILLSFTYNIEFSCVDATDEGRKDAAIQVHGDGLYDAGKKAFLELGIFEEQFVYHLSDGTKKKIQNTFLRVGGIVLGHREVEYTIRYKL